MLRQPAEQEMELDAWKLSQLGMQLEDYPRQGGDVVQAPVTKSAFPSGKGFSSCTQWRAAA